MCVYIYIYTYICIYIHVYTRLNQFICIHVCICVCVYTRIYMSAYANLVMPSCCILLVFHLCTYVDRYKHTMLAFRHTRVACCMRTILVYPRIHMYTHIHNTEPLFNAHKHNMHVCMYIHRANSQATFCSFLHNSSS